MRTTMNNDNYKEHEDENEDDDDNQDDDDNDDNENNDNNKEHDGDKRSLEKYGETQSNLCTKLISRSLHELAWANMN